MVDEPLIPRTIYANLMDEVKARMMVIDSALKGRYQMHDMLREELCYFELRMLCETIALRCLVAHGDVTESDLSKLEREYSADRIIKSLEELNDKFYPRACEFKITDSVRIDWKEPDPLPKAEFLKLYGRVHHRTHRGALRDIKKRPPYVRWICSRL